MSEFNATQPELYGLYEASRPIPDAVIYNEVGKGVVGVDIESTIIGEEAFPWLGKVRGCKSVLDVLTNCAMNGELPFGQALPLRLTETKPDREMIGMLSELFVQSIVPGARELTEAALLYGIDVNFITGGFENAMGLLMEELGIPPEKLHANSLANHSKTGEYTGYANQRMLAQDSGKQLLTDYMVRTNIWPHLSAMMGDGVSDMKVDALLRICFTGVSERPEAMRRADVVVDDLSSILPLLLGFYGCADFLEHINIPQLRSFLVRGMRGVVNRDGVVIKDTHYRDEIEDRLGYLLEFVDGERDPDVVR